MASRNNKARYQPRQLVAGPIVSDKSKKAGDNGQGRSGQIRVFRTKPTEEESVSPKRLLDREPAVSPVVQKAQIEEWEREQAKQGGEETTGSSQTAVPSVAQKRRAAGKRRLVPLPRLLTGMAQQSKPEPKPEQATQSSARRKPIKRVASRGGRCRGSKRGKRR